MKKNKNSLSILLYKSIFLSCGIFEDNLTKKILKTINGYESVCFTFSATPTYKELKKVAKTLDAPIKRT